MARLSGMKRRPIPRKSGARVMYILPAADRIWPHARRRPSRSGTAGRHVVRVAAKIAIASRAASASSNGTGFRSSWTSAFEPVSTAEQKKSVAPEPRTPPVGIA